MATSRAFFILPAARQKAVAREGREAGEGKNILFSHGLNTDETRIKVKNAFDAIARLIKN
ncbi:MAG TPA: hypothetical protein VGO57_07910 [Verrucomicrobiae bacterium]|jgi:hypothetical protein